MSNLHPTFEAILKPHLQGQTVVARKRDTIRFDALQKGWQECGGLISFGTFLAAVDKYERTRDEAHLDRQFAEAQAKSKASLEQMSDALEELRKTEEKEAEREERRQYRAWRNDSGV